MILSYTEENYLKAIFKIGSESGTNEVGTNELALSLNVKPASVNEMLKKLKDKKMVAYEKYGKIKLTQSGREEAIALIRKHRLWETFLCEKLDFKWDEVHEVAEELEHIHSKKLIDKLDKFLEYPAYDPHGDPIPNEKGEFKKQSRKKLSEAKVGQQYRVVGIKDDSSTFLQYLDSLGLGIHTELKIISREDFDGLTLIQIGSETKTVSQKFTQNIYIQ